MRIVRRGSLTVAAPPDDAFELFTPEGERRYEPGWDPQYPAGQADDSQGTVFITDHDGASTIWLIVELDRASHRGTYARITPGRHAGMVSVRCAPDDGGTMVDVEYHLTALPGARDDVLDSYDEEHFAAMISAWESALASLVG